MSNSRIPHKVYREIIERKSWGDPTVENQYKWLQRELENGNLTIDPPASGMLETGANAFADEVTLGLTDLADQPQFVAGEEENPWAAGIGAAIPYVLGGAGAIKSMLKKVLKKQAKPTAKVLAQNEVAKYNSEQEQKSARQKLEEELAKKSGAADELGSAL